MHHGETSKIPCRLIPRVAVSSSEDIWPNFHHTEGKRNTRESVSAISVTGLKWLVVSGRCMRT